MLRILYDIIVKQVQCDWIDCPLPYMGTEQPGTPLNSSLGKQFPISITGSSTPMYGKCPIDKSWPNDDDMMTKVCSVVCILQNICRIDRVYC
jgi:hypothetical protein